MKFKVFLWACLGFMAVVSAFSQQARTVTNTDLEKYKQQRLKAEKDYSDNYARMGFPSPEELQKQIEKSRVEREALAARLAAERIQRERAEAAREDAIRSSQQNIYVVPGGQPDGGYFYGYPNPYFYRRHFRPMRYSPPISVGNGIPINNSNFYQPVRPQKPIRFYRP